MPTAAIYTRLSQDRDGKKDGTRRQEDDCRALCKREGLHVARVYRDDDRSAYNGKTRPAFEQLLADLEHYDALVYWKTDRLVRRTTQFFKVVEACQKADVRLVSVVDPIDTSTPIGQGVAGLLASVGEQESHNIGLRVKRAHDAAAKSGKVHGHRRAFGYDRTGTKIVAAEAKAIREARDRILAGETMTAVCTDWNRRGVSPVSAPAWRVTTFKKMITGTLIAGLRRHGEDVVPGTWPAIITPAERDRLVAKVGGRKRGRPARYLLTGLIYCSRCGGKLRSGVHGDGARIWACRAVPGDGMHCGRREVRAAPVDELVEEAILYRLGSPTLARALRTSKKQDAKAKATAKQLTDLENRLTQLGVDHDNGLISRKEWLARRDPLVQRLDVARADLAHENGTTALQRFDGVDVRKQWKKLDLAQRREVAGILIDRVTIAEPARRGKGFDPDRVDVVWRV